MVPSPPNRLLARRTARQLLLVLAISVLAAPARGHMFWPTLHSAKSAVSVGADGLDAAIVIEVPTFRLVADFKEHYSDRDLMAEIEAGRFEHLEDEFRDAQFVRLAKGLELELNGAPAVGAWRPVDTPVNGKGTEGFFVYMLEFDFAQPPPLGERIEVRLQNHLLQEEELVMANLAEGADGWRVVESSIPPPEEMPDLPEGAALLDAELGLWTDEPAKRDLRVVFAREP